MIIEEDLELVNELETRLLVEKPWLHRNGLLTTLGLLIPSYIGYVCIVYGKYKNTYVNYNALIFLLNLCDGFNFVKKL